MKKIPIFSFVIFVVLNISVIVFFNVNNDIFGETFINQIKVADSNNTLSQLSDEELVSVGVAICESSTDWADDNISLEIIQSVVSKSGVIISIEDRIIPILRFQSSYELCPEYVERLESLFIEK